jgi:hypothetical protein
VKLVWPKSYSLARAYLDQLERSNGLSAARISAIRQQLKDAEKGSHPNALTALAAQLEAEASTAGDAAKVRILAGTVRDLATAPSLARH